MAPKARDPLRAILERDRRYAADAYRFIFESLDHTLKNVVCRDRGHVTGRELLEGIRLYAIAQFGGLAPMVFGQWGVHRTEDFGEIVFALVDAGLMGKNETDTRDDFRNGYDFHEAFAVRQSPRTQTKEPK